MKVLKVITDGAMAHAPELAAGRGFLGSPANRGDRRWET